jgi:hypothetical protein
MYCTVNISELRERFPDRLAALRYEDFTTDTLHLAKKVSLPPSGFTNHEAATLLPVHIRVDISLKHNGLPPAVLSSMVD